MYSSNLGLYYLFYLLFRHVQFTACGACFGIILLFSICSYVPFTLHPLVARQCIAHKVDLVTASYVSPELQVRPLPDSLMHIQYVYMSCCGVSKTHFKSLTILSVC